MSAPSEDGLLSEGHIFANSSHAQLTAVRTKLLQEREALNGRIRAVSVHLNSIIPISRLPLEILVRIFRVVQDDGNWEHLWEPAEQLKSWYALVSVCHAWRAVACATPLLWQTIHLGAEPHLEFFKLCLERSAATALKISFIATFDVEPFLAELETHRSRVRVLEFRWLPRVSSRVVSDFLKDGNMPNLVALDVSFGKYSWDLETDSPLLPEEQGNDDPFWYISRGTSLFRFAPREGQFPRLQRLSLRSISLDNFSALASSLTSLFLNNTICEDVPLSRFLDFLQKSKTLKFLNLRRYRFQDPGLRAWTENASHPLPHVVIPPTLSHISIEDVGAHTARFLSALSIPVTTSVTVAKLSQYDDGGDEFDDADPAHTLTTPDACLPQVKTGLPLLASVSRVYVNLDTTTYDGPEEEFLGWGGGARFTVSSQCRSDSPILREALLGIFGSAPVVELKISRIHNGQLAAADWTAILGAFPLLRRLAISPVYPWASDRTMQDLFEVLASRQPDGTVMSPELTDFAVEVPNMERHVDAVVVSPLAACLEARKAVGKRLARLRVGGPLLLRQNPLLPATQGRETEYTERLQEHADAVEWGKHYPGWDDAVDFWDSPVAPA